MEVLTKATGHSAKYDDEKIDVCQYAKRSGFHSPLRCGHGRALISTLSAADPIAVAGILKNLGVLNSQTLRLALGAGDGNDGDGPRAGSSTQSELAFLSSSVSSQKKTDGSAGHD
jgi:hypothetical protein